MVIMGVVYHVLLLAIEMGLFKKILTWTSKTEEFTFKTNSNDSEVSAERQRVENLVMSGIIEKYY